MLLILDEAKAKEKEKIDKLIDMAIDHKVRGILEKRLNEEET